MTRRSTSPAMLLVLAMAFGSVQVAAAQESAAPAADASSGTSPASGTSLDSVERGPIAPGRYVDRSLGRDIAFSVGDGWAVEERIEDAGFSLIREEPGAPYFFVGPFGGEIFPALQSGTIDGTEWVGPWHDLAFGFYKVTKLYYHPGWHEPGTTGEVMINLQVWESLTPQEQAMFEAVIDAEAWREYA